MKIIDITTSISPKMIVWPGCPKTEFQWRRSIKKGDRSNNSNFYMNSHSGTHVDAPLHFISEGKSVEELSLDILMGEVHVFDFSNDASVTLSGLESRWPKYEKVERLLLKTKNSLVPKNGANEFEQNFCALKELETEWLLKKNICLIGIDAPSIQCYKDSPIVHQLLLRAEVVVVEGLDLSQVEAGCYEMVCLPLKLKGLEGAPARVVLRNVKK